MSGTALFRLSAGGALIVHALLLVLRDGLHGGGDLTPHLRLVQLMAENPGLRSVYAPLYHGVGALLTPVVGLAAYPQWFAFGSAAALIAGFRFFQRATGLPDAASAIFAWAPYTFALTRCLPKIEAAGYALAFVGLGLLWQRRHFWLAICVAATFVVHTAAALFLGLCGGVLALSLRDPRALFALAGGAMAAAPLFAAHLAAGCSLAEAFLFSDGDYLRAAPRVRALAHWDRILVLANPVALVAAAWAAPEVWRRHRPLAILAGFITVLYLNELWLAPFGSRTTLDLIRGLTVLAFPLSISAGVFVASRPGVALGVVGASAAFAVLATLLVTPEVCVSKPIDVTRIERFDVDRCAFRWRPARSRSRSRSESRSGTRAEASEIPTNGGIEGPVRIEGAPE